MVAAMGSDFATKSLGKAGKDIGQIEAASAAGISRARLPNALMIKQHAPDLTAPVIAGTMTLDAAYNHAKQRKNEAN